MSSTARSITADQIKEIQYVLCGPGTSDLAPVLFFHVTADDRNNLKAACENKLGQVVYVYQEGTHGVSGTNLSCKTPALSENYIFISSPPVILSDDATGLVVYIYALKVDKNFVSKANIISRLKVSANQPSPFFNSCCDGRNYGLVSYFRGHDDSNHPNEYCAGAILCLVSSDRLENLDKEFRGHSSYLYIGNESIAITPADPDIKGILSFSLPVEIIEENEEERGSIEENKEERKEEEGNELDYQYSAKEAQSTHHRQTIAAAQPQDDPHQNVNPVQRQNFRDSFVPLPKIPTIKDQPPLPLDISQTEHGTLIYAKESFSKIIPSKKYIHLPKREDLDKNHKIVIGSGGNGIVISIDKVDLAMKYLKYDRKGIEIWAQFDHQHLTQLLGVFVVHYESERLCCQVMRRMTCSLDSQYDEIFKDTGILGALQHNQIEEPVLKRNLSFIFWCILNALKYLKENNVVHQDVKASNVLVNKILCSCENVYTCKCHRYVVELSDFDSVKKVNPAMERCLKHSVKHKSLQNVKVLGTPEYRAAPERWLESCYCVSGFTFIGPWTDMWSFGVFLLQQLLGKGCNKEIITDANKYFGISNESKFNRQNLEPETLAPILRREKILRHELYCSGNQIVRELVDMIDGCLKPQYEERSTPSELLECSFF